jgi:hypothetical protein
MIDYTAEWRRLNEATEREQADRRARFWAWAALFLSVGCGVIALWVAL